MATETNPFEQVYDAINDLFVKYGLCVAKTGVDQSAEGTLVDWNSSRDPEPDTVTSNDLPEFQIKPSSVVGTIGVSSCGTDIQRTYQVFINSGDRRAGILFAKEWLLLGVLAKAKYGALDSLSFNNRKFVQSVELQGVQNGLSNAAANRGIEGWTAIWNIEVRMQFSTADLYLLLPTVS